MLSQPTGGTAGAANIRNRNARLPPEVNRSGSSRYQPLSYCLLSPTWAQTEEHALRRCLYVRNLPFNITTDEMYDIFGKFGGIRQIRL